MRYGLRMTGAQHDELRSHLFPGDSGEAVALLLCGRREGEDRHILTARTIVRVPYETCDRQPDRITWPTNFVDALIDEAYGKRRAIVKIHSHGWEYRQFSGTDDASDKTLFASVTSLLDDGLPHASLVMLPDGELFGRVLGEDGNIISTLTSIMVVGDEIRLWTEGSLGSQCTRRVVDVASGHGCGPQPDHGLGHSLHGRLSRTQ
jgi:Prokaryotic homologs of the JAB domain